MTTPPPEPTVYCPRCDLVAPHVQFRTVMSHVPAGFTRNEPAVTVLKHVPPKPKHCDCLVYVIATIHAHPQLRAS